MFRFGPTPANTWKISGVRRKSSLGPRFGGTSPEEDAERRVREKQEKEIMKANKRGGTFRHIRASDTSKNKVLASGFGAYPTSKVHYTLLH